MEEDKEKGRKPGPVMPDQKEQCLLTSSLEFSDHAVERMAQRNVQEPDIFYVYEHGTCFVRAGALHIFLARKDIPQEDLKNDRITRLIGTIPFGTLYARSHMPALPAS